MNRAGFLRTTLGSMLAAWLPFDLSGAPVEVLTAPVTVAGLDTTIVASGGSLTPFRWVSIYCEAEDEVMATHDYGSHVELHDGESFTVKDPSMIGEVDGYEIADGTLTISVRDARVFGLGVSAS